MSMSAVGSTDLGSNFAAAEVDAFHANGFAIVRGMAADEQRLRMIDVVRRDLSERWEPAEYEADLNYPGAPESRSDRGGHTIRRLLQAHARSPLFTQWLNSVEVVGRMRQLFGQRVVMPLVHHNCIMTKQPSFSSDTLWHQDIRYWSFQRPELISLWLALGSETLENGCLRLIPGSHRMQLPPERFDELRFLREDVAENRELIASSVSAELQPGDVLFFHCRTLHAATRNYTDQTKLSVVFTFRPFDNPPLPSTRSASLPELLFSESNGGERQDPVVGTPGT